VDRELSVERAVSQPLSDKVDEPVTNHLIFAATALFLWIPCRFYADWHMNFGTFDWWSRYTARFIIVIGLIAYCFVLGFNMASGSLYRRFVIPAGVMTRPGVSSLRGNLTSSPLSPDLCPVGQRPPRSA